MGKRITRISQLLKIKKSQSELDFCDYEYDKDTYAFLDPYYISKSSDPFIKELHEYIESFFDQFLLLLKVDEQKAFDVFSHLGEMNEICLGMSRGKPSGRGIGLVGRTNIFNSIKDSDAIKFNLTKEIEDLRLFIDGIDRDKISDMVANIIKYPLIKYTQEQCRLFDIKMTQKDSGYYWNKNDWTHSFEDMIVIDGRTFLLFPKNIVTSSQEYDPKKYLQKYVLDKMKEIHIDKDTSLVRKKYDDKGNVVKKYVFKKDIVEDIKATEHTEVITKKWLSKFSKDNPDVLATFKKETINKIVVENTPISKKETDEIIDSLIVGFSAINKGQQDSKKYQMFVAGILELLFYPALNYPRVEQEINEGRKRIDIVFSNTAEQGFFFLLGNSYNIPSQLIIFECKNYTDDVNNPEIDQLSGRFSASRGRFGVICCRDIDNEELFVKREKDFVKDKNEYIIHLTDKDFISLLELKKDGGDLNDFLIQKYNMIIV